jgi:hypothetical protein
MAAAVPATLFAAHLLLPGADTSTDDTGSGPLSRLAWVSLPVVLLLIKRVIDGFFSLRPVPSLKAPVTPLPVGLAPGMYVSPQSLAETFTTSCVSRVLEAPDSVVATLRSRGLGPPKTPPEYAVEMLLYGVFIHDIALADQGGLLCDAARRNLRASSREVANGIMAEAQRPTYEPDAWNQLVDRRFLDYTADARHAEQDASNQERHLTALCTKVARYATKSHVTSPRATKILLDFFVPELARARTAIAQCILVADDA